MTHLEPLILTRIRTLYIRLVLFCFGVARSIYCRLTRQRHLKKWHGPLWHRVSSALIGEGVKLAVDKHGDPLYVRVGQATDIIALTGRKAERIVDDEIGRLKPGQVFMDGGAYIGQYTVFAAKKVGPEGVVLSVEPTPQSFEVLKKNVEVNGLSQVRLLNIGLGEEAGTAEMSAPDDDMSISTMIPDHIQSQYPNEEVARATTSVEVKTLTQILDEENIECLDVLKLDVEGMDMPVLRGGKEVLDKGRIKKIICEVHGSPEEVRAYFESCGYAVEPAAEHLIATK